jgi:hypothetical protein
MGDGSEQVFGTQVVPNTFNVGLAPPVEVLSLTLTKPIGL